MASLNLTNQEVKEQLGMLLGVGRDDSQFDTHVSSDVNRIIRNGRRRFFGAHNWLFLEQDYPIVTAAKVTTGTVTIASGACTFAGAANLPSTLVEEYVLVVDGNVYSIDTRDGNSTCTLHDTSATAAAGSEFALYKYAYSLPANFGGFLDKVVRENNDVVHEMATLPDFTRIGLANKTSPREGEPEIFSVSQIVAEETGIPTWYFRIFPLPDAKYVLHTRIKIIPGDTLSGADSDPVCHPAFSECLLESILAAAELMLNGKNGPHYDQFNKLLIDAIKTDKKMRGNRSIRPREAQARDPLYHLKIADVDLSNAIIED